MRHAARPSFKGGLHRCCLRNGCGSEFAQGTARPRPLLQTPDGYVFVLAEVYRRLFVGQERNAEPAGGGCADLDRLGYIY